ncbi:MAG: radical SAM-associated putative lipoprotein, partial [Muribaculaceae bacterium]|nr:radical SAM-associated putative lipoprotein [Muribaculaceae bacterium]
CMYGTPTGDFEIKGMVTSEDDQAVPDATVRVTKPDMPSGTYSIETTKTDKDGKYTLKGVDFPTDMKVVCIPDNPMLEADSTIVELDYKKDPKDKNTWNRGHAEATVDFRLKKR